MRGDGPPRAAQGPGLGRAQRAQRRNGARGAEEENGEKVVGSCGMRMVWGMDGRKNPT